MYLSRFTIFSQSMRGLNAWNNKLSNLRGLPRGKIVFQHDRLAKNLKKVKLTKLERTQRTRGSGLAKVGYDPKSVLKFGGIVGQLHDSFSFIFSMLK